MSSDKRKPGRPKGSRNKVNIQSDIRRATETGMSLTDLKVFIEKYLKEVSEKGDSKNTIALIKQDIELIKYLHKMEIDLDMDGKSNVETAGTGEGGAEDYTTNIIKFN